jgi:hypothetical protein
VFSGRASEPFSLAFRGKFDSTKILHETAPVSNPYRKDTMPEPDDKRGEELKEHHDDGAKDRSNGEYNPPHDNVRDNFFLGTTYTEKELEDRAAYKQGRNQHD